tara:strand:- start:132320 stop:132598 length:279 start_codon:yes stop_codon:yes gene_type:complete
MDIFEAITRQEFILHEAIVSFSYHYTKELEKRLNKKLIHRILAKEEVEELGLTSLEFEHKARIKYISIYELDNYFLVESPVGKVYVEYIEVS